MRTATCERKKGGCGASYSIDERNIKDVKYFVCPMCGKDWENPLYDEKEDKPERSYID